MISMCFRFLFSDPSFEYDASYWITDKVIHWQTKEEEEHNVKKTGK